MNTNSFPRAENSIPAWNVDLPPHDVFVAPVSVVGKNSHLVENPKDIQKFIEEQFANVGVKLATTEADAKMRLDCKVVLNPIAKDRWSQKDIESSSIVVEIQLTQERDKRQPYYDNSGICIQPNENVIAGIKECLKGLLQNLTKKK